MIDPILKAQLWLLTKASADEERARILEPREPFLAKLLLDDAKQAREIAEELQPISTL
jgi:hypothetical protein